MRIILVLLPMIFSFPSFGQLGSNEKELIVRFSVQKANIDRAALASEFYKLRDLGSLPNIFPVNDSKQKIFGIDYLFSLNVADNYRTEILLGPYLTASFLNATLTHEVTHDEVERVQESVPESKLTVVENIDRTWTSFQSEKLEMGASLQAIYRFNRRFNMRYGLRAGVRYALKNQFSQIENRQVKRSVTTAARTEVTLQWALESKIFDERDYLSWKSDAALGLDYKVFDNRPFYLGLAWNMGLQNIKGVKSGQIVQLNGFEVRLSSTIQ